MSTYICHYVTDLDGLVSMVTYKEQKRKKGKTHHHRPLTIEEKELE